MFEKQTISLLCVNFKNFCQNKRISVLKQIILLGINEKKVYFYNVKLD